MDNYKLNNNCTLVVEYPELVTDVDLFVLVSQKWQKHILGSFLDYVSHQHVHRDIQPTPLTNASTVWRDVLDVHGSFNPSLANTSSSSARPSQCIWTHEELLQIVAS